MYYCLHTMPSKRRLVTSEICFGTEKAGLLDFSYNKCALGLSNFGLGACFPFDKGQSTS